MKNKLAHTRVYLAGPMEYNQANYGIDWRKEFRTMCSDLNLVFFDPTDKPAGMLNETATEIEYVKELRSYGSWDEISRYMKNIVRLDLRMVDKSDVIVCAVDINTHTCGSYHEVVNAVTQKKPVLLIVEGGKTNCPSWLFGILDHNLMFDSVQQCTAYLHRVDECKEPLDKRWVLIEDLFSRGYKE